MSYEQRFNKFNGIYEEIEGLCRSCNRHDEAMDAHDIINNADKLMDLLIKLEKARQ